MLTNDVVSFEQPGPGLLHSLSTLEIDHELLASVIFPLPLIQRGQLGNVQVPRSGYRKYKPAQE